MCSLFFVYSCGAVYIMIYTLHTVLTTQPYKPRYDILGGAHTLMIAVLDGTFLDHCYGAKLPLAKIVKKPIKS